MKYHKEIYFPIEHERDLKSFSASLNNQERFIFTFHAKEQLKNRITDLKYFHDFILGLNLNYNDIFEYKTENGKIKNAVYRIKYNDKKHIVLSVSKEKAIITLYFNNSADKHYTLNKSEYINK